MPAFNYMIDFSDVRNIFENKSISLVGNASSLFEKNQNHLIDKNDLVCRINRGYESIGESSGFRTDILFYSKPDLNLDISINQINPLLFVHISPPDRNRNYGDNTYFFPEDEWWKFRYSLNLDQNKWPSTGLTSIFFLTTKVNIKSLDIFGFDFKKTKTFYHNEQTKSKPRHDWDFEETYIDELLKNKTNINFFS